jgi:hypothetical protein
MSNILVNLHRDIGWRETLPFSIRRAIGRAEADSFHNNGISLSPSTIFCCHKSSREWIPNNAPSAMAITRRRKPSL